VPEFALTGGAVTGGIGAGRIGGRGVVTGNLITVEVVLTIGWFTVGIGAGATGRMTGRIELSYRIDGSEIARPMPFIRLWP